jgi:aryl-alcohol dehydrogenase-like predicted oxidoreductase
MSTAGTQSGRYTYRHPLTIQQRLQQFSLRRMNIEIIDLYQLLRPDSLTHPSETARTLQAALKSGKIQAAIFSRAGARDASVPRHAGYLQPSQPESVSRIYFHS